MLKDHLHHFFCVFYSIIRYFSSTFVILTLSSKDTTILIPHSYASLFPILPLLFIRLNSPVFFLLGVANQ